jgi:hypothetical protein
MRTKPRLEWRIASDTAPGGLGGVAPVDVDGHAHFGDAADAEHLVFLLSPEPDSTL